MFISKMAQKAHCSSSLLRKLIFDKKIKAEMKVTQLGRKSYFITDSLETVKSVLPNRHGYKKNGNSKIKSSSNSLLSDLLEWRGIPAQKRTILLNLSKASIQELRLLQDLLK